MKLIYLKKIKNLLIKRKGIFKNNIKVKNIFCIIENFEFKRKYDLIWI